MINWGHVSSAAGLLPSGGGAALGGVVGAYLWSFEATRSCAGPETQFGTLMLHCVQTPVGDFTTAPAIIGLGALVGGLVGTAVTVYLMLAKRDREGV